MGTYNVRRRTTIPQELGDEEDLIVNQESFEGADEDVEVVTGTSWVSQHVQTWPREIRNLLAGGLAGMTAKSVVAPLDRIKILYQVSSVPFSLRALPRVMVNIVQSEGFGALWKGNSATMVRVFPYSGIQFMTYDRCKGIFLRTHTGSEAKAGLSPLESLMAGMIAGSTSVLCTYPLDLARAQLAVLKKQTNQPQIRDKGFLWMLKDNYKQKGFVNGLWRGITPTLLGILPYSGVAFTLNEQGKREIIHQTGRDLTTIERMICGALAGLVAQTLTYPIEVTRRRMQTVGLAGETAFSSLGGAPEVNAKLRVQPLLPVRPPNMMATIRDLYVEQGLRGFFKGVTLNWLKGPMAFSISFTAYDTIQKIFLSKQERAQRLPLRTRITRRNA